MIPITKVHLYKFDVIVDVVVVIAAPSAVTTTATAAAVIVDFWLLPYVS